MIGTVVTMTTVAAIIGTVIAMTVVTAMIKTVVTTDATTTDRARKRGTAQKKTGGIGLAFCLDKGALWLPPAAIRIAGVCLIQALSPLLTEFFSPGRTRGLIYFLCIRVLRGVVPAFMRRQHRFFNLSGVRLTLVLPAMV